MNRFDPNDISIHFELPPDMFDFDVVALDSEWFGQDVNKLHRPHGTFGCLACTPNGKDVYMIFDTDQIQEFMDNLDESMQVWHNAQYDIRQIRKYANVPDRQKLWDTMLVEQIRFAGYYNKFALNDLARRYLSTYMDKTIREEFSDATQVKMTDEQILYASIDVVSTWHIARSQMDLIDEDDINIWNNVELPFLWVLLSAKGIYFDADRWMKRVDAAQIRVDELMNSLPFNPRSWQQVKKHMKENYNLNLESTDEKHLQEALNKNPDIWEIANILEARGLTKDIGTYGVKWVDAIEEDGRIYPSYRQMLETGRISAGGDVPIQTTPHGEEYRSSIIAAPGHTLVIKDYSSQEPRILAYISNDKKLINIFREGKDVYISIGYEIFGEVFDKKDIRRQQMKSIILGVSYGMSIYGLAAKMEVDEDTAAEWLDIFFTKFKGIKKFVDGCQEWKPYTSTILGRKFWGNSYKNGWERNYQNMPMQGSAADCTKIAASRTYEELGYNPFLILMHDELVAEFEDDKLKQGEEVMNRNMIEVQEWMHPGIPGMLETFVGPDWSVKK